MNDDMTWDPVMRRIYVSGTQGLSIFHQDSVDTYTEIANIPTNGGKTSYYVPQTHPFFVIHPKTDVDIAGLLIYRVNQSLRPPLISAPASMCGVQHKLRHSDGHEAKKPSDSL